MEALNSPALSLSVVNERLSTYQPTTISMARSAMAAPLIPKCGISKRAIKRDAAVPAKYTAATRSCVFEATVTTELVYQNEFARITSSNQ